MKKLFALALVVLGLAACQTEPNELDVNVGGEVTTTVNISIPETDTRSNSAEGAFKNVDLKNTDLTIRYILQVFTADGQASSHRDVKYSDGKSVAFDVRLIPGRNYKFVCWADIVSETAKADIYYKTDDLTNIELIGEWNAMDEARDAFTVSELVNNYSGASVINIELKRPFAKLRVKTTDLVELGYFGVVPTTAEVTYLSSHRTAFNAFESKAKDADLNDKTHVYTILPYGDNNETTMTLFTDYFFAEDDVVKFTLSVYEDEAKTKLIKSNTFNTDINVKRNYLTTISGNILTDGNNVKVDIVDAFENEYKWPDNNKIAEKLAYAAMFGGEVTLTEDVELTQPLEIVDGAKVVINLNGKTITGTSVKGEGAIIENNGILTLVGGTIKNTETNGDAVINNNGELVLDGVKIEGAPLGDGGYSAYAVISSGKMTINGGTKVYADRGCLKLSNGGETFINGGLFVNNDIGTRSLTSHVVDVEDGGNNNLTINGGTFEHRHTNTSGGIVICNRTKGTVYINDGNFNGGNYFSGQHNLSDYGYGGKFSVKGGKFSDNISSKYIAAGYKAIASGGKYIVVTENADAVASTPAEVLNTMKVANQTVYIVPTADGSDYKLDGKMSLAEGVKLIGMGDTPVALFNDWGSNAFGNQAHFTNTYVENINFTNNLVIDAGIVTGDVKFVNCVFGGNLAHQGVHFDSGNGTLTFDGCTFVGRNMLGSSIEKVVFNNCTFLNKKSSQTGPDKWTGVNMWGKYEFNNCTFDTEAHCNVKCDGVVAAFNSCSYTDNRDITSIINNSNNFTADIKFDGNKYISEGLLENENGNVVVYNQDALASALAAGKSNVTLAAGEYTFPSSVAAGVTINCEEGTVFTGKSGLNINGATVIGAEFKNENGVAVSGTINGTFKNCTFTGSEALRWCYSVAGNTSVFENCVIKTDFRGFHYDDMNGDVIFRNCEINGFNAYGGNGTATFEGCTFGCDESSYNGLNIYSNTNLVNCTFNFVSGKTNFIDMEGTGKTLTITNCTATLDGANVDIKNYVGGSKLSVNTVVYK